MGSHLSCLNVAAQVCATYPKGQRATSTLSYLVLLRVRFIRLACYQTTGRLLPCLFILTEKIGGFLFCDTVFKITLTGRYPARCSVESGLSSGDESPATAFRARQQSEFYHHIFFMSNTVQNFISLITMKQATVS